MVLPLLSFQSASLSPDTHRLRPSLLPHVTAVLPGFQQELQHMRALPCVPGAYSSHLGSKEPLEKHKGPHPQTPMRWQRGHIQAGREVTIFRLRPCCRTELPAQMLCSNSWQTFSIKGWRVIILGFAEHMDSVANSRFCHCSIEASTDKQMNERAVSQ